MKTFKRTSKNKNSFNKLKFVLAARANKNMGKENLRGILVEKGNMICTDGRRLHIAQSRGLLEDGYYAVRKELKTVIKLEKIKPERPFPNYYHVFPKWKRRLIPKTDVDSHSLIAEINNQLRGLDDFCCTIDYITDIYSALNQSHLNVEILLTEGTKNPYLLRILEVEWKNIEEFYALIMPRLKYEYQEEKYEHKNIDDWLEKIKDQKEKK
jgi:hypothetical protein